jgi:nitrous oxidase accessory protein
LGEQRKALILLLILILLAVSFLDIKVAKANSRTLIVPDDYSTIANAVGNATDGDTIFVKEGTYEIKENQKGTPLITGIEINKTLSIIGEDQTNTIIVFPPDTRTGMELLFSSKVGFLVHADNFVISNLTITNCDFGIQVIGNKAQVSNILTSSIYLNGNYSRISGNNLTLTSSYPRTLTVKGSFNDIVYNSIFYIQCEGSFNTLIENSGEEGRIEVTEDSNILAKNYVIEISLSNANLNTIYNNSVSSIRLVTCYNNTVSGNVVKGGRTVWGILMASGSGNVFYGNNITDFKGFFTAPTGEGPYGYGVAIGGYTYIAEKNLFYHNNFVNNYKHVSANWPILGTGNYWDNGEEGNYWDDYSGVDSNGDGIGDVPYTVKGLEYVEYEHVETVFGQDRYPLMAPITVFDAGTWEWTNYNVDIISNSTVSDFSFNPETALIRFNVKGETGTTGFCRVTIPKDLLDAEDYWTVLVDGNQVTSTVKEEANSTYLYFTYQHSTKTVEIIGTDAIPEFPSRIILPLFLIATIVVIVYRQIKKKSC